MISTFIAGDIRVGTRIAAEDGFLWTIEDVVEQAAGTITVRQCANSSSRDAFWTRKRDGTPGGIIKTYPKNTKLSGAL